MLCEQLNRATLRPVSIKTPRLPPVLLTVPEGKAYESAIAAYRRRTGDNKTHADIVRDAIADFCAREGINYPRAIRLPGRKTVHPPAAPARSKK